MQNNRLIELDIFKGWAIVLMVIYHFYFDLNYFHYMHIEFHRDVFWLLSRYLIVSMFLLSVGISLAIAHTPKIQWDKVYKRLIILGGASLLISIVTYVVFPHAWVYFGILHFIFFASFIGLLFLPYPLLSLCIAISFLLASQMGWLDMQGLFLRLQKPLHLPTRTEDLVPFIPWFSVILIGMALTVYGYHVKVLKNRFFKPSLRHNRILAYLGQNALLIYLLHLPLLFGGFYIVEYIN